MLSFYTAEIFKSFLYGAIAMIAGGYLFEHGKRYVKVGGGNQFRGKIEAFPFFVGILIFGWALQQLEPFINEIVITVPPSIRLGSMIIGSMLLYNYTVGFYNYDDSKSLIVYTIGIIVAAWPYLSFT